MTRDQIVREWIEAERLKLLERLEWERWHGWKTVSEPPAPLRPVVTIPAVAIHRSESRHWASKGRAA